MGLYSLYHILYIVLFALCLAAAVLVFIFALKTDKAKEIFIRCLGGLLTVSLIANRIALAVWDKSGIGALELIPNTYCGMTSLLLGLTVLIGKPHSKPLHFLFYMELLGGTIAVFYPNFLDQNPSFFFAPTITGLNHHACGIILCIILILGKWFEPSLKNWWLFPIGICAYTVFGLFLIDPLNIPNTMHIDTPMIAGTPLKWWFVLLVGTPVGAGIMFSYEKIKAYVLKRKSIQREKTE